MRTIQSSEGRSVTEYSHAEFKAEFGSFDLDAINAGLSWRSNLHGGNVSYHVECVGHGYLYIVAW